VDQVTQIDVPALQRCAGAVTDVAAGFARATACSDDTHLALYPVRQSWTVAGAQDAAAWSDGAMTALGDEIRDLGRALAEAAADFRASDEAAAGRLAGEGHGGR
jgi:hypothetical protein